MLIARLPCWSLSLLGRHEKQRLRTSMAALATTMMLCCTLVMYVLAESSGIALQVVHWWGALAVGGLLAATLAVRSGLSERWSDPSLTQFQMQWALTCNAAAYVIAGSVRALALPVLVIILMFGIFGRSRRQMVHLMVYSMALYGVAVLVAARMETPHPPAPVVLAHLAVVLLSLLVATLMCLKVQRIRARLRQQKIDLQAALAQIRELAMHDALTGLVNRRQMADLMQLELRRCQRNGRPLLLAQLDIDHFKAINDTHGHAAGDNALRAFAAIARAHIRDSDVLARWGGEEFVLMLCDTEAATAAELLERLRCAVARMPPPQGCANARITVSIGWAQHRRGEALEQPLERADQALYAAKRSGRDRVVRAPAVPLAQPPGSLAPAGA